MEKLEKEFYRIPETYVVRVVQEMPLCHSTEDYNYGSLDEAPFTGDLIGSEL